MNITNENRGLTASFIEEMLFDEIAAAVSELEKQDPSVNWTEMLNILRDARNNPDAAMAALKTSSGDPDPVKTEAFSKLYNIQQTIRSYTPILMERAHEAENDEAFADLDEAIDGLKIAGYNYEDTCLFLSEIKIAKSSTSHPTEGLNEEGIALCELLVDAAERDTPEKRAREMRQVMHEMIMVPNIGASEKSNVLNEIDVSNPRARILNAGCNRLERHIKDKIESIYGQRPDDLVLDIGGRSWDYDSDGKNNAEGWAFMAKMSTSTMGALNDTIKALKSIEAVPDERVGTLIKQLEKTRDNLQPIYERSREMVVALAEETDPEARQALYGEHYAEYQTLETGFGQIYDHVDSKTRGFTFYDDMLKTLADLRGQLRAAEDMDGAEIIDEVYRNLRRNGLVLEKGQPRQNDIIHAQIIDNLFYHSDFRERCISDGILSAEEFESIDGAGGFNKLKDEVQRKIFVEILSHAKDNGNRDALRQYLFDANLLGFDPDGNGYPSQERTLLDRLSLRALFPAKFDHGIISDCGSNGPARQKFIADLFGLTKMKHMPLHEDRSTLPDAPQLLKEMYGSVSGPIREKAKALTAAVSLWKGFLGGRIHETAFMRACSDAERGGGSGTRLEAIDAFRGIVRASLDLFEETGEAVPLEILLGCGLSMQRYGGDPEIIRSVVEQELKAYVIRRGCPFDHRNKQDRRIMRSALTMLWTEQGRAKRIFTAMPGQISSDFARRITHMIHGRLDLEGAVPDHSYIPKLSATSEQEQQRKKYYGAWITEHAKFRHVVGENGRKVIDTLSDSITCPTMIKYANNGARPGSKSGGSTADNRSEKRAIENNQRDYISEIFLGRYGGGAMLRSMLKDCEKSADKKGHLSQEEFSAILKDPIWTYNIFIRDVTDAARTDYQKHALKNLNWDTDFNELMALGKDVILHSPRGEEDFHLRYDGNYSDEQACFAKAYYDHVIFVAQLEAVLDGRFDQSLDEMLAAINPKKGVNVSPGPKTLAQYPTAAEIAKEHEYGAPGLALVHMLEDHINGLVSSGMSKSMAIKEVGGEAFLRHVASAWRAGTMPHWPLWSGAETCMPHNKPSLALDQLIVQKRSGAPQVQEMAHTPSNA